MKDASALGNSSTIDTLTKRFVNGIKVIKRNAASEFFFQDLITYAEGYEGRVSVNFVRRNA